MCQNHSSTTCTPRKINSTNYALEQALLADDSVLWERQRLLIVEAIEAGAQVDHPAEHIHGNLITALYLAVIRRDKELIKYLMEKKASPYLDIYDNASIFSYVDFVGVAQQFIASGIALQERAGSIFGGLLHGLMQPVPEALDLIAFYLSHGANPNLPDWSGDTPLHILARMSASYADYLNLLEKKVHLLKKAGGNLDIKNLAGNTVTDVVSKKSNQQVIDVFLKY